MTEYVKIETIFQRDTSGSKKLIEGQFINPYVEYLKDNQWVFTEKVDGVNTRIYWDGHKITFGGRTEDSQIPARLINYLNEKFINIETEELFEQNFGEKEVILFGEGYGPKIQKGEAYRQDNSFILFDVMINGNYQERDNVENIAKCFDLDIVPIIFKGTLSQGVNFVKTKPKSTMGTAFMEGLVARPERELQDRCGKRIIVKIKVKDFSLV